MIEKIKAIPEGTKVTLHCETLFGENVKKKATFLGHVRQHGYINKSGSWGLYPFRDGGEPCYVFNARLYRERVIMTLKWKFTVKDISIGWEV